VFAATPAIEGRDMATSRGRSGDGGGGGAPLQKVDKLGTGGVSRRESVNQFTKLAWSIL
jgi:hypothetical protein